MTWQGWEIREVFKKEGQKKCFPQDKPPSDTPHFISLSCTVYIVESPAKSDTKKVFT